MVNDNTFQRTCNLLNTNTSTYTILKCLPFTSPLLDDPGRVFGSGSSKRTARSVEFQQPIYSEKEKKTYEELTWKVLIIVTYVKL